MFDVYYCPRVVHRMQNSRDASVLSEFIGYLDSFGYSCNTIHQYVRAAERFLRWLRRHGRSLTSLDEAAIRCFSHNCRSARSSRHSIHAGIRHLLCHLRAAGFTVLKPPTDKPAVERLIAEYDTYLDHVCGLAVATRLYRRRYARDFVKFVFGSRRMDWRCLRIEQVRDFITQYGTHGRTGAAQVAAASLRSFLRWLQFQGRIDARFVASVPCFRRWRWTTVPAVMTDERLDLLLASFDRSHPTGRRDFAMALCMVDLGLRVSQVAALRIDQFDAERGVFRLTAGKSRRECLLPTSQRVQQAVTTYIRCGRPQTQETGLFVRHRVPIGSGVTRELVRGVMRRAYAKVPGCEQLTGTHVLRHTAATRLQRSGADLKRIADILGHRSLDTTMIYTKVDLNRLTEVSLPWPATEEGRS